MMYAIFLKTDTGQKLVYRAEVEDEQGRIYWLGGSGTLPLIFHSKRSASSVMKRVQTEFRLQHRQSMYKPHRFYVAPVIIFAA